MAMEPESKSETNYINSLGEETLDVVYKNSRKEFEAWFHQMAKNRSSFSCECAYYLVSLASIGLFVYGASDISWPDAITLLIGGALMNHLMFELSHVRTHAAFIAQPVKEMHYGTQFAGFHHYFLSAVFYIYWIAYQSLYFFDTDEHGFPRIGDPLSSVTCLHFAIALAFFCTLDFPSAMFATGYGLLLWNLQGIVHKWYHVHHSTDREFIAPNYWMLTLLERLGIISTKEHQMHHEHRIENMADVKSFSDIKAGPLNNLGDHLFNFLKYLAKNDDIKNNNLDKNILFKNAKRAELVGIPLAVALNIFIFHARHYFMPGQAAD